MHKKLLFFFHKGFCRLKKEVTFAPGEMAERSNAAVLKTVDLVRGPGVRIPLSPPNEKTKIKIIFVFSLFYSTSLLIKI